MDLAARSWAVRVAAAATGVSLKEGICTCSSTVERLSLKESSEEGVSLETYLMEVGLGDELWTGYVS